MKKILLFILSFVILGFSMSCKDSGKDPLAYQTGNISAEIVILKNGCPIDLISARGGKLQVFNIAHFEHPNIILFFDLFQI